MLGGKGRDSHFPEVPSDKERTSWTHCDMQEIPLQCKIKLLQTFRKFRWILLKKWNFLREVASEELPLELHTYRFVPVECCYIETDKRFVDPHGKLYTENLVQSIL